MENPDDLWPPAGPHTPGRADRAHRPPGQRSRTRGQIAPALSRDEIVDAAIAVADAEGANALSMRKIAQVLHAGTMSLYWHVANKEHLLDLMLDVLVAEVGVPEPTGDWRADLQKLARENRASLLRHRWVMDFIGGRPPLGPNTLLNLDGSLAILDGLGLDTATTMNILMTVGTYVMGAVLREFREIRAQRDQAGIDPEQWRAVQAVWRRKLVADGRFSHFLRILDDDIDPDAEETRDERFEFGLDCVLDGIAMQLQRLQAKAPGHSGPAQSGPAAHPAGAAE